ncbi:MAG: hypothetical protein ACI8VW_001528 [bacterium]|jgi:hypothetical protein
MRQPGRHFLQILGPRAVPDCRLVLTGCHVNSSLGAIEMTLYQADIPHSPSVA